MRKKWTQLTIIIHDLIYIEIMAPALISFIILRTVHLILYIGTTPFHSVPSNLIYSFIHLFFFISWFFYVLNHLFKYYLNDEKSLKHERKERKLDENERTWKLNHYSNGQKKVLFETKTRKMKSTTFHLTNKTAEYLLVK